MNRILVIDDKKDNLVAIQALLNLYISPCDVITSLSGREGISLAASQKPDTILLDVHMPEMDGFEVLTVLKNNPGTAYIPVVILTAMKTAPRHRVKALEMGAEAFLTKPIDEAELAAQVKAMLRIKKAEDLMRQEQLMLRDELKDRVRELERVNDLLVKEVEEHKKTEKDLRQSEIRFQKVFNSQLEAIFILENSTEARILDCNSAVDSTFGYDRSELAGSSMESLFVSTLQKQAFMDMLGPALRETGFLKEVAFSMKRRDNTVFPAEITVLEMRSENGRKGNWIVTVRDLTERKRLEASLQQAQKMESIGTLAGGIAHDFNNILSPLIGFAEILQMDLSQNDPAQDSIKEVLKAAFRAKELVRQILTFSRQSSQKHLPLKLQPILKEVTKLLKASIPKTIVIKTIIDRDCGLVKADPTEIHQIVMNLATNAYHAMEETGGQLNIRLETMTLGLGAFDDLSITPGLYQQLTVEDTGHGMDEATMTKIFDPYFTTKSRGKGTGLGLAVVLGILRGYGGEIRVASTLGKGTTFTLYFPVVEVAETSPQLAIDPQEPMPRGSEHILLVDDEKSIADVTTSMLERLGYKVTVRLSGFDALEAYRSLSSTIDLVIADLTMPQMTGLQLYKKIKLLRSDAKVIICTGFSEQLTSDKSRVIGIEGFLNKPVIMADLAHCVRRVLDS